MKQFHLRRVSVAVIAAAGLMLAGCGGPTVTIQDESWPTSPDYRIIHVVTASQVYEDITSETLNFEEKLVKDLNKLNIVPEVKLGACAGDCTGALTIQVQFMDVKKVSGTSRFFFGAFAGKATVESYVTFIDEGNKRSIASYVMKGDTGSTGYSGDTKTAFDQVRKSLVKVIKQHWNSEDKA